MIMSKLNKQNKIMGLYSNSKLKYTYAHFCQTNIFIIFFLYCVLFFLVQQINRLSFDNYQHLFLFFFQNLHRNYKCLRRFAVLICNQQNTQHNVYCMIYFVLYIRNYSAFFVFKYCTNSHLKYSFSFYSFSKIIFNCSKKYIKIPIKKKTLILDTMSFFCGHQPKQYSNQYT